MTDTPGIDATESPAFTADELATLREHGIVIWADRVIYDAQRPMLAEEVAAVQAQCVGPLPEALTALWRLTAGGHLDYDLTLPMNGNLEAISFTELFFNDSGGYRDLAGWIEHEQELAGEANKADDAKPSDESAHSGDVRLAYLPIGGFEYCDRIYVTVSDGPSHGQVLAWKQGLPPAWAHALHEDGLSPVAPDLRAAFGALYLGEDPLDSSEDFATGQSLVAWLDERHEARGLELELMDKLLAFYRRAVADWRGPLETGDLRHHPALAKVAVRHAISHDDASAVAELAAAGIEFTGPLDGSAGAVDVALSRGSFAAASALVRAGAPVQGDALNSIDGAISPELTTQLLAEGAKPTVAAMVQCVACGAPDSARLIGEACVEHGVDLPPAFADRRAVAQAELEAALVKTRNESYGHYLGPEGLSERIENLRSFEL